MHLASRRAAEPVDKRDRRARTRHGAFAVYFSATCALSLSFGERMKRFYIFALIASVVSLVLFCTPTVRSNVPFVDRLALWPDKWELKLHDPDQKFFRQDEQSAKANLLAFLQRYRDTYRADVGWLTSSLAVAAFFSWLGWMRERELQKQRAEPITGSNSAPPSRSV